MPSKAALEAMANMADQGPDPLSVETKKVLLDKALAKVQEVVLASSIFDEKREALLSRYEGNETKLGKLLGTGSFCSVYEVNKLVLTSEEASLIEEKQADMENHHRREFMSMACIRNGEARYAVKRLSEKSLADEELFLKAVADLATEARFLAVIQHPNIIKVRGFGLGDFCSDKFFIMMDRLYDTLEDAIRKWREENKKYKGFLSAMRGGKQKAEELFIDRMNFSWDLSSAFQHLHEHKIIYRDLKPENVGFDVRGDVKIFDFGLAKELKDPDKDGNYALTGYCGSPLYMAPEVITKQPYNEKADMYSFAILLWEMMALQTPYLKSKLSLKSMLKVVVEKNHRPALDKDWPKELKNIIRIAWHPDPQKRFAFGRLKKKLHDCVMNLGREANQEEFSLDKSTRSFQNFMAKA